MERPYELAEEDLKYGWITPECARTVYGIATDSEGGVDVEASDLLRESMRRRRAERSVDARDWWKKERDIVIRKDWNEDVYNMFVDNCKVGEVS